MSVESIKKYYDKMQKTYMDCIKDAVATALFEAWGENWYAVLQQKDIELTDETNRIREESAKKKGKTPTRVNYITDKFETILKFDFQACNKLLYYMDEVRGILYKEYDKSEIFSDKTKDKNYRNYFNELIEFRNSFEGHKAHENEVPNEKEIETRANAISSMRIILKDVLCNVVNNKDIAKRTYFLSFEDYRTAYEREILKKPYLLEKYIDYSKYDAERFYEACQDLGIEGKKIEGKDVFYSANFDEDLEKLKNALSVSSAVQSKQSDSSVKPAVQNEKSKQTAPYKVIFIVVLVAVLCIVIAFLLGQILNGDNDESSSKKPENNLSSEMISDNSQIPSKQPNGSFSSQLSSDTTSQQIPSSQPQVTGPQNELNDEYNQDVEEFKYINKSQQNLRTLKINVGEKVTPQAATVWTDCEIFSQNTAIAKATGSIVQGIARGETYIVVEGSTGISQVYKVVVG